MPAGFQSLRCCLSSAARLWAVAGVLVVCFSGQASADPIEPSSYPAAIDGAATIDAPATTISRSADTSSSIDDVYEVWSSAIESEADAVSIAMAGFGRLFEAAFGSHVVDEMLGRRAVLTRDTDVFALLEPEPEILLGRVLSEAEILALAFLGICLLATVVILLRRRSAAARAARVRRQRRRRRAHARRTLSPTPR
jgi:hypothetical protein